MCAVTGAILFTTGALLAFALVSQRLATTSITGPIVFVALGLLASSGGLASERGKALYGRRQGSVESVFGQIKANRGFRGFQRRGRLAVRSEWRLVTATHNLLKLHQHRLASA